MKTTFFRSRKMAFGAIGLLLIGGISNNIPTDTAAQEAAPGANLSTISTAPPAPGAPGAPAAQTAPVPVPEEPSEPPAANVPKLSPAAEQIVKLAQSGVSDDVMLTYVGNAAQRFGLGPDQIIYLNDLGVSDAVVKSMIQRDQALAAGTVVSATATNAVPALTNYPTPETVAGQPVVAPPPTGEYAPSYTTYDAQYYDVPDEGSDYFYGSLSPYGSWVNVGGYGLCWQPTVYVLNHNWRPYCDRGRWIYTTSGWYWQSDYSWGWAPFHYGRWYCDARYGWVWRPDRVWGPSWVSWRWSNDYCGWAPLPPAARFVPGIGFTYHNGSVAFGFEFGLGIGCFTFVPTRHFCDPFPFRHHVPPSGLAHAYHNTTVINHVTVVNGHVFNHGFDPHQVASVTHHEIHPAIIKDVRQPNIKSTRGDRLDQSGKELTVFAPHIPPPNPAHPINIKAAHTATTSTSTAGPAHSPVADPKNVKQPAAPPRSVILAGPKSSQNVEPVKTPGRAPDLKLATQPAAPAQPAPAANAPVKPTTSPRWEDLRSALSQHQNGAVNYNGYYPGNNNNYNNNNPRLANPATPIRPTATPGPGASVRIGSTQPSTTPHFGSAMTAPAGDNSPRWGYSSGRAATTFNGADSSTHGSSSSPATSSGSTYSGPRRFDGFGRSDLPQHSAPVTSSGSAPQRSSSFPTRSAAPFSSGSSGRSFNASSSSSSSSSRSDHH